MANNTKNEILLETGTNEVEILEFIIADQHFGINVSKVVEIMINREVTPMPNANPNVEGVFKPRGEILTLINLPKYLHLPESKNPERDVYIISQFNSKCFAFHVHAVEVINHISWEDIEKPDSSIYGGEEGLATGIARINDRLVTIIDFEKIVTEINPSTGIQISDITKMGARKESIKPILVAEDSPLLEKMICESLEKAGYINIIKCSNGAEAWDILKSFKPENGALTEFVSLVVTDIEMPKMDGHKLLKLIRGDSFLKSLPVIIFSSLINEAMYSKGESIGATAQITKPEIAQLVGLIDKYIL